MTLPPWRSLLPRGAVAAYPLGGYVNFSCHRASRAADLGACACGLELQHRGVAAVTGRTADPAELLATADQVQLVLTGFMMALGMGQLIAGTLSDRFGRRPVMLVGSALFLLGGVGAFIATSIDMLVLMRFCRVQGCCLRSWGA